MHLFHIPQCSIQNRNVHISVVNGALLGVEQVHSGICETVYRAKTYVIPSKGLGICVYICNDTYKIATSTFSLKLLPDIAILSSNVEPLASFQIP